ncbi:MAG: PIN domain nuclease [Acidobacteria bacterium]|nr:MAG: PIN domain nuclease [Acidobacteriota bacterium]
MYLVDTSVWVEVFSRGTALKLDSILDLEEVVACPPVIQEVLQGFRDESAFRIALDSLTSFPVVEAPMPLDTYLEAADLYRAARRAGLTVRSSVDCLIAACALRHGLTVLHKDRDYDVLVRVSALKARNAGS